jgi:dihydroxyacetone kinase-like predicted kinase
VGALHHRHGHESSRFRYCTNFAVTGRDLDAGRFVPPLETIGDSVMVVGDSKTLKVHVHTDDPDAAVGIFEADGEVSRLDVADMRDQVVDRDERLGGNGAGRVATSGVLAVVNGRGIAALYEGLGARVVDGGPTLNPSTYDLLAGIHSVDAAEVVLLPNSANVRLAAEGAASLSEKPVTVVPTASQQAAIPALLSFDTGASAAENAAALTDELRRVRTGGVAEAARDDAGGRFRAGDALGYVGEELVAWGETAPTLTAVLAGVADGCEVLTCIAGEGAPLAREAVEASTPAGVELDYHEGGQPAWWWLLCAE